MLRSAHLTFCKWLQKKHRIYYSVSFALGVQLILLSGLNRSILDF